MIASCATATPRAALPLPFFPARTFWTLPLNNPIPAPPAYAGGRGFFPIAGDRLAAYDLASGRQLWIVDAATSLQPAAGDGLVFVATANEIVALRQEDGSGAWRLPFGSALAAPLVWDNGWLIASAADGGIVAFRAADGRQIWRYDAGAQVHATPALAADRVYIATVDARLIALQIADGALVWERRLGGPGNAVLALDEELYVGAADNYLYSIGAAKGDVQWRWRTGGDVIGRPAADASRIYFVSLDNVLRAMSRKTGAQIWKRALPMRPTAGPLLAGTTLLVSGLEPTLRAYSARDGAPATDIRGDNVVAAPPVLVTVPSLSSPLLLYVTNDIASGATVTALAHSVDPDVLPAVAPLPNVIKP